MARIVCVGDNDVDCYLSDGRMYPGGNCFNVSVFARRSGVGSAYIGAVGDDAAGRLIRKALESEGVDSSRLRVVKGDTAHCVIGHSGGDRQFVSYDLGVSRFEPDEEDLQFIASHDAAHVYQHAGLDNCLGAIAARTRLSYDFSTRREASHRAEVAPRCWLASFSGAGQSREETIGLVGAMHATGAKWVLATRGSEGALLSGENTLHEVAAAPASVVDTLGAGDSFIARVLVGLLRNETPKALLQAAAQDAARACEYFGAVGYGAPSTAWLQSSGGSLQT
ncbi:MAG TPA: PfkB family carbohydrate kinase [Beijerinckiaceae bacterium]|nr:PfkB family carbohydrate kinase [Beijerinckiaceae bacterium]